MNTRSYPFLAAAAVAISGCQTLSPTAVASPATAVQEVADVVKVVDEAFRGSPTEVAVLGTAHLAELGDRFTPGRLEPLIQRLERWRPAVITVEADTGRDCDEAKARPDLSPKDRQVGARGAI